MSSFSNKRAYITGGSSGIGKATAIALAGAGAHVVISARGKERLFAALKEVQAAAAQSTQIIDAIEVDVADRHRVQEAATFVLERLGGLDIVVNNAGISHVGKIRDTRPEDFERVLSVNYLGTVWTTLAFLPHFYEQKTGSIVAVSSILGVMGLIGYSAYSGSKFAINGFFDSLRQDLLEYGVHVCVVCPPDTDTPQWHEENKFKPAETRILSEKASLLQPEDVAAALLKGIATQQYVVFPGRENKLIGWANDKMPWLVRWAVDRDLRKYWKTQGA